MIEEKNMSNLRKSHLERELEKARQLNNKSNLLNPQMRNEYLQYLEEKEWLERQMDRVRRGLPVEDRYPGRSKYLKRKLKYK